MRLGKRWRWGRGRSLALAILFLLCALPGVGALPSVGAQELAGESVSTLPPGARPVEVLVELYNVSIDSIDERTETFEVDAYLFAAWYDERHAFDAAAVGAETKVFQGETAVEQLKTTVWHPDFEILDARGPRKRCIGP